jgi:hypothetical protein
MIESLMYSWIEHEHEHENNHHTAWEPVFVLMTQIGDENFLPQWATDMRAAHWNLWDIRIFWSSSSISISIRLISVISAWWFRKVNSRQHRKKSISWISSSRVVLGNRMMLDLKCQVEDVSHLGFKQMSIWVTMTWSRIEENSSEHLKWNLVMVAKFFRH